VIGMRVVRMMVRVRMMVIEGDRGEDDGDGNK
jgi:hypothetical protein